MQQQRRALKNKLESLATHLKMNRKKRTKMLVQFDQIEQQYKLNELRFIVLGKK